MQPPVLIRAKVCCISTTDEARLAVECGASAVGLVSAMPSGPGVISEEEIATIAGVVPPGVASVLLTSKVDAHSIIQQHHRCRTNTLQLVDAVPLRTIGELRDALPGVGLIQVIHVGGEESIDAALFVADHVDALLLDSGNPTLSVKELGGTGRTHNWDVSRRIREAVAIPVFLAGGLNAGNVGNAIAQVGPFGVDVCSGVRTNGRLDRTKLVQFFAALNSSGNREYP